jgi:hypothetical protein
LVGTPDLAAIFLAELRLGAVAVIAKGGRWRVLTGPRAQACKGMVWICRDHDRARDLADELRRALRSQPIEDGTEEVDRVTISTMQAIGVLAARPDRIQVYAERAVEKIEAQFKAMQDAGGLKSVNNSYREYRIAQTSAGLRAHGYKSFIADYLANIVRKAAQHSRITFEDFAGA